LKIMGRMGDVFKKQHDLDKAEDKRILEQALQKEREAELRDKDQER